MPVRNPIPDTSTHQGVEGKKNVEKWPFSFMFSKTQHRAQEQGYYAGCGWVTGEGDHLSGTNSYPDHRWRICRARKNDSCNFALQPYNDHDEGYVFDRGQEGTNAE
jgi:hypothetical protein